MSSFNLTMCWQAQNQGAAEGEALRELSSHNEYKKRSSSLKSLAV
jgi:hypothetical protein